MNLRFRVSLIVGVILTLIIVPVIFATFAWYVSTSNDANVATNEIKTVVQGYGGHFSTKEKYDGTESITIFETGDEITSVNVKPGDLLYYAFIFDVEQTSGLKAKYQIDLVLNASSTTGTYHGVSYGNYNSLLSNLCIEEDTIHLVQLQRSYDNDESDYKYVKYGDVYKTTSIRNSEVESFYSNSAGINASFELTMPTISNYPSDTDNKGYFLVLVPIWYVDTEELQNNELNCSVKISSTIIVEK